MVKQKDLEKMVSLINTLTESPKKPYSKDENGEFQANLGNYHLDFAYGGVRLCRMTESGGSPDISDRHTKKELKIFLSGFLSALRR